MFSGLPVGFQGIIPGRLGRAAQALHALELRGRKLVLQESYLVDEVGLSPKVEPPGGLPSAPFIHPHGHLVSTWSNNMYR